MIEIKHRITSEVIFTVDAPTLSRANLSMANLLGADLYEANLSGADLSGADLSMANLSRADLYEANLSGANLSGANLYGANLLGANLYGADLSKANLSKADLYGANLSGANLYGANLSGANLSSLQLARFKIVPDGDLIGYKKLKFGVIATLLIPKEAKRVNSLSSRKCRAEWVEVLALSSGEQAYDQHTGKTLYKVGEKVYPDKFDDSVFVECTNGIHFFITKEEAEVY